MEMTREQNFYMAKISEQAERFDETRMYMAKVIGSLQAGEELTAEERSLLSIAYKNVIGVRLASWRNVCSVEHREANSGSLDKFESIRAYRDKIVAELSDICNEILRFVDERLLPFAESAESKVFYLKIEGDYNRYIAEFKIGAERSDFADKTLEAYKLAQDIALTELAPSNPIRLGLALNFSVFYYKILNSPEKACSLAKQAFDEAAEEIKTLEEEPHKDTTLMMQLLRDNLTLWNSDMKDDLPDIEEIRGKAKPDDKQQLNPGKN